MKGLLPLYVTVDTARALLTYALLHSGVKLSPTSISLGSEALKLAVASIAIGWAGGEASAKGGSFLSRIALSTEGGSGRRGVVPYLKYAVPAALFLANNVMYLSALSYVTPALLQTCVLSKLPLTALLHHLVVKSRRNKEMWISLGCLSLGLVLAGSPDALWDGQQRARIPFRDLIAGPVIGLTIGIVSACSSIWTELVFKEQVAFWSAQFWLYLWGTVLACLASLASHASTVAPPVSGNAIRKANPSVWPFVAVVIITACSGLSVAVILKQRDNLVKLVGTSLCITTLYVFQHICFPLAEEVESRAIIGIGILTVSTWAYNYHKDQATSRDEGQTTESPVYTALNVEGDKFEDSGDLAMVPNPRDALANSPTPSAIPQPTPSRLALCAVVVLLLAFVPPFLPRPARSIERDFTSFFSPRHIYPADWSKLPAREHQRCVMDAFNDGVDPERHPSLLADWEERIVRSTCPVYPVPDSGLTFHARWLDGSGEGHALVTDTFLATQSLRQGHRLIWWYLTNGTSSDGPDEAFQARYLAAESPFAPYVEARQFDLDNLASGTCAEELLKRPTSHELLHDLGRTLVLARYGGIWIGDDSILLRDLTPLIRTGPLVPGLSDGTSPVDDLLIYGPAWSGLGERVLDHACTLASGSHSESVRHLRDLHETCIHDPFCGVKPFPMQWATGSLVSEDCQSIEAGDEAIFPSDETETRPAPAHLHGIFAWRARAQSRSSEDPCWKADSGSALAAVRARTAEILETMPLGLGVDLFPGPGFVDTRPEIS